MPSETAPVPTSPKSGLLLALETSGKAGSVALAEWMDGEAVNGRDGGRGPIRLVGGRDLRAEQEHASRLIPAVEEVLAEAGARPSDLVGLVVGAGPGSFTGVRVAAATAKGMAWSMDLPLWAFSSLAGAAAAVDQDPEQPRMVLFDARGDRLYAAAYRWANRTMDTLSEPRATTVAEILDGPIPPGTLLVGDGARRHQALFQAAGFMVLPAPAGAPSARGLLEILTGDPGTPPVEDVGAWEPDYLRQTGAERIRRARTE